MESNLYVHPLAGLFWARYLEDILWQEGYEEVPFWACLHSHRESLLFLSTFVDDLKVFGRIKKLGTDVEKKNLPLFLWIQFTWAAHKEKQSTTKI